MKIVKKHTKRSKEEEKEILNEENILSSKIVNDCVPPLVSLLKDTIYLFSYKYNMPFPLYDFSSDNNHEIWNIFSKNISEVFPLNSRLFEKYFHWAHAQEQKTDEPKVNPYKTSDTSSEDSNSNSHSSFRKDPYFKGQKHKNYKKSKFNGHRSKHFNKASKEAEVLAMAECKSAIEEIKLNPDIDFIVLKPQNSYIRRLQHSEASAAELFSLSQGEDKSRAVVIYREKQV